MGLGEKTASRLGIRRAKREMEMEIFEMEMREMEMNDGIGNGVSYVMSLPYGDGEPREGGGETRTIYMCGHAGRLDIIDCLCTRY